MENISTMNIDKYENISQVIDIIQLYKRKKSYTPHLMILLLLSWIHITIYT